VNLTVACVWVRGHVPFSLAYVQTLQKMVARSLGRPYKFVCLTDRGTHIPHVLKMVVPTPPRSMYGWWSKLQLFRPGRFKGRVVYLDLDTLIVDALDPIVDFPSEAALVPDSGTFKGNRGRTVVKRFNSSVMVWDAGVMDRLYETWTPQVAKRLHGDQDWIGEQMPEADTMPLEWFPRLSQCPDGPPDGAKVILAKVPKNMDAAKRYPWFAERWQ
jgi:hypothetical protein